MAALAELGVISGYDGGSFRPDGELTRAELCAVLYKTVEAVSLIDQPETEDMEDVEMDENAA